MYKFILSMINYVDFWACVYFSLLYYSIQKKYGNKPEGLTQFCGFKVELVSAIWVKQ